MQDQLTGQTGTPQQQKGDIQQNSPNLQQRGTPTSTANSASVLSENAPNGNLRVSTTTTPSPSLIQPDAVHRHSANWWLLLLIIPAILATLIVWPKKAEAPVTEESMPEPPVPQPVAPKKPTTKSKKKSQKRKKSG